MAGNKPTDDVQPRESTQDVTTVDGKPDFPGHIDYKGIDTTQVQPGADAAYEAKIVVLNEALIDIGMGPFQWKIFATTGFGWFVDNVNGALVTPSLQNMRSLTVVLVMDASRHQYPATRPKGVWG